MKRLLLNILMILFLLGMRPAEAMTVRGCDAYLDLTQHAMNLRLQGVPLQDALRRYDEDLEPDPLRAWRNVATSVYTLERNLLTGSRRADFLSQLYAQCLRYEGQF